MAILGGMTLKRMDNVGVVVDDLAGAVAFFKELGMELEGEAHVEGRSVDRLVGIDGVRSDIAMMRNPDGHGRLELTKFRSPIADSAEPNNSTPDRRSYLGADHSRSFASGTSAFRAWARASSAFLSRPAADRIAKTS